MSWPTVKLSSVAQVNPRLPKDVDESQEVVFLPMAAVSEDAEILTQEKRILSATKKGFTYFEKNDVVVAKITPCFENGKAAYLDCLETQIGFGTTEFHVIRPNLEKLDGKYLFYLIWSDKFRRVGARNMSGSAGQKRVPADFLKNIEIPLPPLAEQKRIAAILDKADAIRQKRQQAIHLADDFLRSVFLDMFGDPVTNPKGWEVKKLATLVTKLGDGLHGTPSYDSDGDYCFVNGNNLINGTIITNENTKRVNEDEYLKHKKELNSNTILVSINGTIGKVAFYQNEKIVLGKSACYFNLIHESISRHYLYHLIQSDYFIYYVNTVVTGSTIKNVSLKSMRELPIPIPSKDLQEKFDTFVKSIAILRNNLMKSSEFSENNFSSLSQKAFAGDL